MAPGPEGFWERGVNEEIEVGHHALNLHDLNEDTAGQKTDEATGEAINNSGEQETADTTVYAFKRVASKGNKDALGIIPAPVAKKDIEADKAAEEWLKKHDPTYKKAA